MNNVHTQNKSKLINSQTKVKCRKIRNIFWYHESNKIYDLEKYAQHLLLLFHPHRDEKKLFSGCPPLYQKKLQEFDVQNVVNSNKIKFKPYVDLVGEAYSHYNDNICDNQDPFGQIENDKTVHSPSFMRRIMADNEVLESISSLNYKPCDVFGVFIVGPKNILHTMTLLLHQLMYSIGRWRQKSTQFGKDRCQVVRSFFNKF